MNTIRIYDSIFQTSLIISICFQPKAKKTRPNKRDGLSTLNLYQFENYYRLIFNPDSYRDKLMN